MFIDRWTGAPARLYAIARPAMVAAALLVALTFSAMHRPAQAHGGEDHGTAASVLPTATQPRATAVGDEIEAVAVIKGDDLLIYVDRFGDNSPVLKADVVVTIDKIEYRPQAMPDGVFFVQAPKLNQTGPSELIIAVQAADFSDLLIATLPLQKPAQAIAVSGGSQSAAYFNWRTVALMLGGLAVATLLITVLRRRNASRAALHHAGVGAVRAKSGALLSRTPVIALTIASLLGTLGTHRADAHDGHDHGGDTAQTLTIAGDAPRRLDDGSVFLPKATQRLLSVRTFQVKATSTKPGHVLVGRIIANPNTSGVVQSSVGGRLTPPLAGLPHMGQAVKVGDVLGYVTPAFLAIDSANVAQTAGDLDQQLDLAKTKLVRAKRLLETNAGTRVAAEEAELQVRGLEKRRAALGQSQIKSEPLLAPVDGVIANARAMAGQVVAPQDILFEIIDPSSLLVEAFAFDQAVPQTFEAVSAHGQSGASFELTFLGRSRALRQQSTILHFEIKNPPADLNVGMPVTVNALAGQAVAGILLPKSALVRAANGEDVIWRHTEPERFIATPVASTSFDGERVLIQSGLKPGERVVVQGAELINQVR